MGEPERTRGRPFKKGNKRGPGRPKGSFDRVAAIFDAIRLKVKEGDTKDAVALWLSRLDDKTLALLYARAMPRDVNMNVQGRLSWAQQIEKMQKIRGEKETPDADET